LIEVPNQVRRLPKKQSGVLLDFLRFHSNPEKADIVRRLDGDITKLSFTIPLWLSVKFM
jgi:hypothetical protein